MKQKQLSSTKQINNFVLAIDPHNNSLFIKVTWVYTVLN